MYYLNQVGRGLNHQGRIGPVFSTSIYESMESAIFFGKLPLGSPLPVARAKAVGRETLRNVGKILTDIVENKSPEVSAGNIVKTRY